jgi:hypothetical protein
MTQQMEKLEKYLYVVTCNPFSYIILTGPWKISDDKLLSELPVG